MANHHHERMRSEEGIKEGHDEEAQNGYHDVELKIKSLGQCFDSSPFGVTEHPMAEPRRAPNRLSDKFSCACLVPNFSRTLLIRKIVAEVISTYCLVFTGCGAAVVNTLRDGGVTPFGISVAFGIVVMVMVYSVGHISGAHMNPAVTIAFATTRHFPWIEVPIYIAAQIVGAVGAGYSLRLIFGNVGLLGATTPAGSLMQSFGLEIIITFILMFVVAATATDTRAVGSSRDWQSGPL